jgi:hypothetical protein
MQAHETDRIKHDARDWSIECVQCGRRFEATRSDASFCGVNCRVAYRREADKLLNFMHWLNTVASMILTGARKYRRNQQVYELMVKLQKDINAAVGLFETD